MNTKSHILLIAFFAITLAGCGVKNSEQDQAAVEKIRLDFIAAFNAGDIKGIEPLIDQHAVWQIPGYPLVTGKENIVARYADAFAASQSTLDLKPGDIQLCDGWALLNGDFTRTDRLKSDNTVRYFTGHYLFACKKQAAVDEHFSTDYFQAFGPKISNFVSGPAEIKIITVAKEALK